MPETAGPRKILVVDDIAANIKILDAVLSPRGYNVVRAENGQQALQSAEDWWTVVLGSGYRWTVEQMNRETVARVREANIEAIKQNGLTSIATNVIYAVASKRSPDA